MKKTTSRFRSARFLLAALALCAAVTVGPREASGAQLPLAAQCYQLYVRGQMRAAIAACETARNQLKPQLPRINDLFHRAGPISATDESYALEQGQNLFLVAFTFGAMTHHSDNPHAHDFALDAAGWAELMAALIQQNKSANGSALYERWSRTVASFMKLVNVEWGPAIFLEVLTKRR